MLLMGTGKQGSAPKSLMAAGAVNLSAIAVHQPQLSAPPECSNTTQGCY